MPDPKKVFVIHGRNEDARKAMFAFLRSIGLQPMEWTEAVGGTGQRNPFIGEILDSAFASSQAIIALFTGDDLARLGTRYGDEALTPQARANVIFEAGMALGRFPDRTILAALGVTRGFSDVAGRHIVEINDTVARRQALAMRLRDAGSAVQIDNQTDWQTEGQFDKSVGLPDLAAARRLSPNRRWLLPSLILAVLATLLFLLLAQAVHKGTLPIPAGRSDHRELVSVSGRITRPAAPNDGILVGIIPAGALGVTNSDGTYEISFPATNVPGAYTAVAYDHGQTPYIGGIPIVANRGTFDHAFEDR